MPSGPDGSRPRLDARAAAAPGPGPDFHPRNDDGPARGPSFTAEVRCEAYQPTGLASSTYMSQLLKLDGQVGAPLFSFLMLK